MTMRPVTTPDGTSFPTLSAAVVALHLRGCGPAEVARLTGASVGSCRETLRQLRKRGLLPPARGRLSATWHGRAESTIWLREATLRKFRAEALRRCIRADQLMGQCLDIIIDDRLFDALLGPYVPAPVKAGRRQKAAPTRARAALPLPVADSPLPETAP